MEFKFVNKSNDYYAKKNGERELNDILEVKEEGELYYRIYLNNLPYYAELLANKMMLKELKIRTWTLDNKEKNSKLVKSNSESEEKTLYLSDILEKFGYDRLSYEVYPKKINKIPDELYREKRREYSDK